MSLQSVDTPAAIIYPAPNVTDVYVSGSTWSAAFRAAVATIGTPVSTRAVTPNDPALGFRVADAGVNGAPLPWANLDTIALRLDAAPPAGVVLDASRVTIEGSAAYRYAVQSVAFDDSTLIATLRLATPILNDRLRIALDLETHAGPDREIRLNVLPGDFDQTGVVNAADLVQTRNRVGRRAGDEAYSPFADLNGDGIMTAVDLVLARNSVGRTFLASSVSDSARSVDRIEIPLSNRTT